ncbi:hypothetical protein, partial [Acinetobacter baumannii]|uniref:hypothetical protein n=1 Tax=Acinetobacter baumannii TaxID=470 RepID=UPI00148F2F3B
TRTEFYGDKVITIVGRSEESKIRDLAKAKADNVDLSDVDTPGHWEDVDAWTEGENFWDETFVDYDDDSEDAPMIPLHSRPAWVDRTYATRNYSYEW